VAATPVTMPIRCIFWIEMADNVKFKEWQCHDDRPAICKEEALKRTLAFAGIHAVSVSSEIDEVFAGISISNFEGAEGTWTETGGILQGVAGAGAQWYKIRHSTEVELGFVATFDWVSGPTCAFLLCCDDSYDGYGVFFNSTGGGMAIAEVDGTSAPLLSHIPFSYSSPASITVMAWPQQHTTIDEIDELTIAAWVDGQLLLSYSMPYVEKGKMIGFAVYQNDTTTFDNLRIAQLHQVVEWTSVDPGEIAGAGLSRVIGYGKIRIQARHDGSVRIWRNNSTTPDWTVPSTRPGTSVRRRQIYSPSHWRMVGALHEIDDFRAGYQGHIFEVGQDPNALSEDATADRAGESHRDMEEEAAGLNLAMAPNPVVEPEDVLTWDGEKWRVNTIAYRAQWRGGQGKGAPVLESSIDLRECLGS